MAQKWSEAEVARIREQTDVQIARFAAKMSDAKAIVVSTADGRPLASWFSAHGDRNRVSAMISSLLAVCETASKELLAGRCQSAVVCAESAHIVVMRIGGAGNPFVLAIAFDATLLLGTALRTTADFAGHLARIVNHDSAHSSA